MKTDIKEYPYFRDDDDQYIAIACGKTDQGNNHTGLLVKHGDAIKMLHFA